MYISGRRASLSCSVRPSMKLPTKMPAKRAMMKPASLVSPRDQVRWNLVTTLGVATMGAQLPSTQQAKLIMNNYGKRLDEFRYVGA